MLGAGFVDGNEAQWMIYLQEAHLMAAVKEGNVAEVRRLVKEQDKSVVGCMIRIAICNFLGCPQPERQRVPPLGYR